jgi:two-component system LytT family response regulator
MSISIRALIVDDESLARDGVRLSLGDDPEITIIGECANGDEALAAITQHTPDLVFLDIQMPGMTGLEVLRRLPPERLPMVVFITAYDDYAVQAFTAHALDYLLKPIDPKRFADTMSRVKERFRAQQWNDLSQRLVSMIHEDSSATISAGVSRSYLERFTIKMPDRIYFVPVTDVDWIAAEDNYVRLHTGTKSHLLRMTLAAVAERLDPKMFIRVHRSTIVSSAQIKELQPHFQGEYHIILHSGAKLKSSRSYRASLDPFLGGGA